jgi:phosphoribosyl-AMP cyclohydrolase
VAWVNDRRPDWSHGELLPVVVIDVADGALLMLAWADATAVAATEATGEAHFWSRSRERAVAQGRDERQRPPRRRDGGRL